MFKSIKEFLSRLNADADKVKLEDSTSVLQAIFILKSISSLDTSKKGEREWQRLIESAF